MGLSIVKTLLNNSFDGKAGITIESKENEFTSVKINIQKEIEL